MQHSQFLMEVRRERGDAALVDFGVLVLVLADSVEVLDIAGATQELHKVFIVGDNEQLEIALTRTTLDDSREHSTETMLKYNMLNTCNFKSNAMLIISKSKERKTVISDCFVER